MNIVNNFRAHVLHHSSAAEKLGKHELALDIVRIKQGKNNKKIAGVIAEVSKDKALFAEANIKLNKLLDKDDKYQTIIAKNPHAETVMQLAALLEKTPDALKQEGIFRISPSSEQANKISSRHMIQNFDELKSMNNVHHIVAHRIKAELQQSMMNKDSDIIDDVVKKCANDATYIPALEELPKQLAEVVKLCQHVITYTDENKMTAKSLAIVLAPRIENSKNAPNDIQNMSERIAKSVEYTETYQTFLERCISQSVAN
ncbi:RhoGAP domain-containing protein [Shewanella sp. CG12_big_fil_rev_8_21_14_0_65_47_15]|uniref:RhoGAP domain-containing protein n=1 Tax=Shewanella sp. CG12_big_fil_rev_8_21_14_0_65_47_15 TaxID=1975537 RepID=UPI000CAC6830|nr:RhoGAP domain-containing protein [Shewanella sp. CG12_big_fil_rev_8_21_14_0_65_47_15]PIW62242.1 MAG: hypothetical protein COW15_04660 [Shewanella sp. CG12_big_fil_rev_8_21_14_0_65_47_15]